MLISSPRHRPEDIALWRDLEAADRLHGGRLLRSGAVDRAAEEIRRFAADGPCYASVSWGKDSVVLAHLVVCENERRLAGRLPMVPLGWVTVGGPDVGCPEVRDCFLSLFPNSYREILVAPGGRTERGTAGKREGFLALDAAFGRRRLIGLRADESGGRAISLRRWGVCTEASCRPLGWWTEADVFGYLAVMGLPVHPNYAMLGGGRWPREHLRTAPLGGKRGDQFGRAQWEAEYYGDVLRRLEFAARP